jgi:hypothetical protein
MLTVEKFHDAVTAHFARSRWLVYSVMIGCVLILVAETVVASYTPLGAWGFFDGGFKAVVGVLTMASCMLGAWHNEARSRRDPRLLCPHCERPLQMHGALVIATRNCPNCGLRVLAEPTPPV